jgi:hypothetical protein
LAARSASRSSPRTRPTIPEVVPGRKRAPDPWRVAFHPDLPPPPVRQHDWLRIAAEEVDAAWLRADARRNVLTITRLIGWSADWRTGRSRPTLARLVSRSGLSLRTVQRWCRWLERRGLLEVLEPGVTPRFRPGILHRGGSSNLAREWRLALPVHRTVIPSWIRSYIPAPTRTRARHGRQADGRSAPGSAYAPPPPVVPQWPPGQNPRRRGEQLAAAETLRAGHPVLRRMSPRALRSALRVYFREGWTPADVLHALETLPSGARHQHGNRVGDPPRWVRWRLSWWLDGGKPRPPHSAELAGRAARARAGRYTAPGSRGTPPPQEWRAAKAALTDSVRTESVVSAP